MARLPRVDRRDLAARIAGFSRWHYEFELDGQLTPVSREIAHRHPARRGHVLGAVQRQLGGRLDGLRVLDLGCNAGFWSLAALEAGAESVVGVDARAMHIEQAELVFAVKGVDADRYRFVESDIFDLDIARHGRFDVCLCLGLLYHVGRPVELLGMIAASGASMLVIDTALSTAAGSMLEICHDDIDDPRDAVGRRLVMWPTIQAVVDLVAEFGFQAAVIEPEFEDWTGLEDYRSGRRRAVICVRAPTEGRAGG
ncbi:MAG: tRNA (mo5U34)-methyltransferase [Solirubrobacteraceae bacterium]|nr:tRNA (mo5U34)-methyltransferase [Solirubrobacteraceae bacterium]